MRPTTFLILELKKYSIYLDFVDFLHFNYTRITSVYWYGNSVIKSIEKHPQPTKNSLLMAILSLIFTFPMNPFSFATPLHLIRSFVFLDFVFFRNYHIYLDLFILYHFRLDFSRHRNVWQSKNKTSDCCLTFSTNCNPMHKWLLTCIHSTIFFPRFLISIMWCAFFIGVFSSSKIVCFRLFGSVWHCWNSVFRATGKRNVAFVKW